MSDDRGPWGEDSEDLESRSSLALILWLGLLLAIGLGVWALFSLLPGPSSSDEDLYPDLVYLVAILAFVSSGIIFTRRFNFGEVARNIAVWTGLAALLLIGYTYRTEIKGVFYRVAGELLPGQGISITENELVIVANKRRALLRQRKGKRKNDPFHGRYGSQRSDAEPTRRFKHRH